MKTYLLTWEQHIPIDLEEAWNFFSSPFNLEKITPGDMNFKITSPHNDPVKMYEGMIITYKVSPLMGIRLDWTTEITHLREKEYFVDEQRLGPYALWHHQHHFKEIDGGVRMTDILNYAIPYGAAGRIANSLFVNKKVQQIFKYRQQAIAARWGSI